MSELKIPRKIWIHALGAKVGGGITYLRAILPEIISQLEDKGVRIVLLVPTPLEGTVLPEWFEVRVLPAAARNAITRLIFDQVVLPLSLRTQSDTVLYCSGSFSPLVASVPTVVLLRNAIYFDEEFLKRELPIRRSLLKMRGALIAIGARGCAAVHYPSHAMRQLVEAKHPELAPLGCVNSYGVGEAFLNGRRNVTLKIPLGEGRPVTFLYLMNYTLQKNLGLLLRALALAREAGVCVQVIVTSMLDRGPRSCYEEDRRLIESYDLIGSGYLVPVGPKYGEDLLQLYRSVDACIFPSFCESFGHPLVEALALGKPLVCADRPYAREICREYALYVDPNRPEDLVQLWREWSSVAARVSPAPLEELLQTFSWRGHVARLLEALLRM